MTTTPFKRFAAEDYRQSPPWFNSDFLGNMNILVDGLNGVVQNGINLINGSPPSPRQMVFQTNNAARWAVGAAGNGESSTSNTGSDFAISRYSNSGTYIDSPITIDRATGLMTLSGPISMPNYTPTSVPANGGNEQTIPILGGGLILKMGTFVCTLVNDGAGNALGTVTYVNPFPHGLLTVMAQNGDAFANGTRLDMRIWNSTTYFDFLAASGVIGSFIRINWIALGS